MAESMKGLHRSHRCAEVVNAAIGSESNTANGTIQLSYCAARNRNTNNSTKANTLPV